MDTYTLNITFTGLCLFVPEPAGDDSEIGRMTVLLPRLGPQHHHGMDRHVPLLGFDVANAATDAVPGTQAFTLLRDLQLVLEGNEADLTLCPEIVNLSEVTGRPVHADHLQLDQTRKLASRIRLGAGKISGVARGACWQWGDHEVRPISHMVRWTIEDLPGTELKLQLPGLHTGSLVELPALRPLAGAINLFVYHLPPGDLPPEAEMHHEPAVGSEPPHFAPFYNLFGADPPTRLPRYAGKECSPPAMACPPISPTGANTFTCMVAAGTAG